MTIEQAQAVIAERPPLHLTRDGSTRIGGLNRMIGERFIAHIGSLDKPRIAETGTGLSTLVFLSLEPSSVISISPDAGLHERTRAEAAARQIDTTPLRLIDNRSESALPQLALSERVELDVAFIDGNHGWPAVFVDFCYMNMMLQRGGLLFVDDLQLYSVSQLVCLLRQQAEFELVDIDPKMATFRKVRPAPYLPDWRFEPYITMNTATA